MQGNKCISLHLRVFLGGPLWVDSLCHTPPLHWQYFLHNIPRKHEQDDKKVCVVDVHDGSWFIEVVVINMLSCHRQHFQHYRVWITLFSQLFLLNYLQCMDQLIVWSFYAHSAFSQFVHWVISCYEEWWPCLVSFHVMEQIHGINDQHMGLKLGPNLVLSQVSLSRDVALLL